MFSTECICWAFELLVYETYLYQKCLKNYVTVWNNTNILNGKTYLEHSSFIGEYDIQFTINKGSITTDTQRRGSQANLGALRKTLQVLPTLEQCASVYYSQLQTSNPHTPSRHDELRVNNLLTKFTIFHYHYKMIPTNIQYASSSTIMYDSAPSNGADIIPKDVSNS